MTQTATLTAPSEGLSALPSRLIGAEVAGIGKLFESPDPWLPLDPDDLPHHRIVPRDLDANIAFRKRILDDARSDPAVAAGFFAMCEDDPIFWMATFLWTYNPNAAGNSVLPFIPYPYEEDLLLSVICASGDFGFEPRDIVIEKSREMGATWTTLAALLWRFQFREYVDFLIVSRNEEYVDKTEDKKSLFWKLDFMLKMQPSFIRPPVARSKRHLKCLRTESTIEGEATTGDIARGDRRTAIMIDEFAAILDGDATRASTADASRCRIFISTHKGTSNAFRDLTNDPNFTKLRTHWIVHPDKGKGAWYDEEQERWRSPWYDRECRRRKPAEVAAELDMQPAEAGDLFFPRATLLRVRRENCLSPTIAGILYWNGEKPAPGRVEFRPEGGGHLSLWLSIDKSQPIREQIIAPPRHCDYAVGADISLGVGASNSVAAVIDQSTGEKVAELVSAALMPEEFAVHVVALCYYFTGPHGPAILNYEVNGAGQIFGRAIDRLGFRRLWYRQIGDKRLKTPGYSTSGGQKLVLLGELRRAIEEGEYVERSAACVQEAAEYIHSGDTVITTAAPAKKNTTKTHGDRVIATAIAWMATKGASRATKKRHIPPLCIAKRRQAFTAKLNERKLKIW